MSQPPLHEQCLAALLRELGDNLYSCCLYGSAVRGNAIAGQSDLNLLVILRKSDPPAHDAIARALAFAPSVDPFILGLPGLDRSVRCFGAKFSSIKRNYELLHGVDVLSGISIAPALEKFLCEQALRNLRLRLAFSYITRARHQAYLRFLSRSITPLFLRLSEIIRLQGGTLPTDFAARVPVFHETLGLNAETLLDLLRLKKGDANLGVDETEWHARVFPVLDEALEYIGSRWTLPFTGDQGEELP